MNLASAPALDISFILYSVCWVAMIINSCLFIWFARYGANWVRWQRCFGRYAAGVILPVFFGLMSFGLVSVGLVSVGLVLLPVSSVQAQSPATAAVIAAGNGVITVRRQTVNGAEQLVVEAGDPIYQGDEIAVIGDGQAQLMFRDQTVLSLGADSIFSLQDFAFNAATSGGKFGGRLIAGHVRFLSGKLGRQPDNQVAFWLGKTRVLPQQAHVMAARLDAARHKLMLIDGRAVIDGKKPMALFRPGWGVDIQSGKPGRPRPFSADDAIAFVGDLHKQSTAGAAELKRLSAQHKLPMRNRAVKARLRRDTTPKFDALLVNGGPVDANKVNQSQTSAGDLISVPASSGAAQFTLAGKRFRGATAAASGSSTAADAGPVNRATAIATNAVSQPTAAVSQPTATAASQTASPFSPPVDRIQNINQPLPVPKSLITLTAPTLQLSEATDISAEIRLGQLQARDSLGRDLSYQLMNNPGDDFVLIPAAYYICSPAHSLTMKPNHNSISISVPSTIMVTVPAPM